MRHQANMRNIQASGAAHQQRMADMPAIQDAQFSGWMQQQASAGASNSAYIGQIRQETPFGGDGGRDQHLDFLNARPKSALSSMRTATTAGSRWARTCSTTTPKTTCSAAWSKPGHPRLAGHRPRRLLRTPIRSCGSG